MVGNSLIFNAQARQKLPTLIELLIIQTQRAGKLRRLAFELRSARARIASRELLEQVESWELFDI